MMRGVYGIYWILAVLIGLPLLVSADVTVSVPHVPVQTPCAQVVIPLTITSSTQEIIHLAVLKPYDKYLTIIPPTFSLTKPTKVLLSGQLPCSITSGIYTVPFQVSFAKKQIKREVMIPLRADYSFSIIPKEKLPECAEEKITRKFILKNKGNVPAIYSLTTSAGTVSPERISLLPGKEQVFLLRHSSTDEVSSLLFVETGKKKQSYDLQWEKKACFAVDLSLPEQIHTCAGENAQLVYELRNNGIKDEEVIVSSPLLLLNDSLLVKPGEIINKTHSFLVNATGEQITSVSTLLHGKEVKTPITIFISPSNECTKLHARPVVYLDEKEGTFTLELVNEGIKKATYSLEVKSPGEVTIQTKTIQLEAGEEGDVLFSFTNLSQSELVLLATNGGQTQTIHIYLDTDKPFFEWQNVEKYSSFAGLAVLVALFLICGFILFRMRIKEEKGDDLDLTSPKSSWFLPSYESIDFDHLFEENQESAPRPLRKPFPLRRLLYILGTVILLGGLLGIMIFFPEAIRLILLISGGLIAILIGVLCVWFAGGKCFSWLRKGVPWKLVLFTFVVLALAIFSTESPIVIHPLFNFTSTVYDAIPDDWTFVSKHKIPVLSIIFGLGGIIVFILLISLIRKGWNSLKKRREQKAQEKEIIALATKISDVERKTRSLKNMFIPKSLTMKFIEFFFSEEKTKMENAEVTSPDKKPLGQYFLDFFYKDIPEETPKKKEQPLPILIPISKTTKKTKRKRHPKASQ